jgi:hypothetical protein
MTWLSDQNSSLNGEVIWLCVSIQMSVCSSSVVTVSCSQVACLYGLQHIQMQVNTRDSWEGEDIHNVMQYPLLCRSHLFTSVSCTNMSVFCTATLYTLRLLLVYAMRDVDLLIYMWFWYDVASPTRAVWRMWWYAFKIWVQKDVHICQATG